MSKTPNKRGLSGKFIMDLKEGILLPFLERVHADPTLDLEIRNEYINIYYRGGSMFRVEAQPRDQYKVFFDTKYSTVSSNLIDLPKSPITCTVNSEEWVAYIPQLKDTMDLWFGKHPKEERALQQLVAWENNSSSWANSTDYFIIDIEYDNHKGAKFDLVALRWDSTASTRKLSKGYIPRLVIIEMKAGDGAIDGKAGIGVHIQKTRSFLQSPDQIISFKDEMMQVFKQKRELRLIKALRKNDHEITQVDQKIDFMFLFAGHDPSKRKLLKSLDAIDDTFDNIQMCVANFMGFALYAKSVDSFKVFKSRSQNNLLT